MIDMAKANMNPVVKKDAENPEPDEVIAKHIIELSEAAERWARGPLKKRAICLLLKDATGISVANISNILDAMAKLRELYTK